MQNLPLRRHQEKSMKQFKRNSVYRSLITLGCAIALAGCGGGGSSDAGTGTTATGNAPAASGSGAPSGSTTTAATISAVTTGPITGFGSIIVNGTRYDDSSAKTTLDDDRAALSSDLRLGMIVQVESERSADGSNVRATSIAARSFLEGPVTTIAAGSSQLTVLGVTVIVTPTTVFDGLAGLSALAVNDVVEIYGIPDATGRLSATRIEKSGKAETRLVGTVQNASATSFTVGSITVQYTAAALNGASAVSNGTVVRIKGNATNATTIVASSIRPVNLTAPAANGQRTEVEGIITAFTDASHFVVNGVSVSVASGATLQGVPALGARVEVEGTASANGLTASKVEVKNQGEVEVETNELHGAIFSLNSSARTFTMRNGTVTVKWDSSTVFDSSLPNGGNSLAVNLPLEVKGRVSGNLLLATRIKIDK
jgi:hypothetical protein